MSEGICDNCGEKKVSWGKICEGHHFICQTCSSGRDTSPVCKKKLIK